MKKGIALIAVLILAASPFLGGEIHFREIFIPETPSHQIFFELRLPRLLAALIVGAGLSLLGGAYQILFQNPLAEPYLLGTSNAVTLGMAVGEMVLGFSAYSAASMGLGAGAAFLVTLLLLILYRTRAFSEGSTLLALFGMGTQFVLSSLLFLLISLYQTPLNGAGMRWLFGQIPWLSLNESLILAALSLPCFSFLFVAGRSLDALSLGDSVARTLGTSPDKTRTAFLCATSIFVSILVSFTGAVGFVGLVVPHAVRLFFKPRSARVLFGYSFLVGGLFLVLSDVVSRILLPPLEVPVGVITTLLGGPLFLYLLWRNR